jgi:hypothetical protein
MADNWDSEFAETWDGTSLGVTIPHPVFILAADGTPGTPGTELQQIDALTTLDAATFFLEREGLVLDPDGLHPSEWKLITAIYPILSGEAGTEVIFYLGGEIGQPESALAYQGPYSFIIGTTTKIDCLITCRYPAFQMSVTTNTEVILEALGFEYEAIGQD